MRRFLFLLALLPAPAFAHAFLLHATPGVGSQGPAPSQVVLVYTEGVEVPFCQVVVTDAAGNVVSTGKPQAVPGHDDEMAVPVHITAPGRYTVTWHAVAVDTHHTEGSFSFTVTP